MKRLAILGASGHGKVIADTAELCGWKEVLFFDDAWPDKSDLGHWTIMGNTQKLIDSVNAFDGVIVAIGNNYIRDAKTNLLLEKDAHLVNIIHPSAEVSRYAKMGKGSAIFANAVVNADTAIGDAAILNTACTIDHDCKLGNAVHVSPGAHVAGGVVIGCRSWIGIGSCVKQCIEIGSDVLVGAGAVVVKSIPNNVTAVGNPAKFDELRL